MSVTIRTMPEIVRDIDATRLRHAEALAAAEAGAASRDQLETLAGHEAELRAFERLCIGTGPHCLMATGLLWDDELRHPSDPGLVAKVRLSDRVLVDGVEIGIHEATAMLSRRTSRSERPGLWACGGIVLGHALGIDRTIPAPAGSGETTSGSNYSLF